VIDTTTLIRENARIVGLLQDEQQYAQVLSTTLLAVGHHQASTHQLPGEYDDQSHLACVAPGCLEKFVRAFVDDRK
jgi:hypothetical protein